MDSIKKYIKIMMTVKNIDLVQLIIENNIERLNKSDEHLLKMIKKIAN